MTEQSPEQVFVVGSDGQQVEVEVDDDTEALTELVEQPAKVMRWRSLLEQPTAWDDALRTAREAE